MYLCERSPYLSCSLFDNLFWVSDRFEYFRLSSSIFQSSELSFSDITCSPIIRHLYLSSSLYSWKISTSSSYSEPSAKPYISFFSFKLLNLGFFKLFQITGYYRCFQLFSIFLAAFSVAIIAVLGVGISFRVVYNRDSFFLPLCKKAAVEYWFALTFFLDHFKALLGRKLRSSEVSRQNMHHNLLWLCLQL